ncbi:uncharacterized protein LOC113358754 isoform X1 [Papaver somniferum]|uniref:uncharacterized protein LOC113358754 isoform X1 n=1 Tax=Papaver somniferum TaxID=3469 RepID=UPI000E6FE00B|nr:uncharacterized protein LOC113358754 isoform X1 [Papaver somniferum]XP_026458200.1 uncharacterized protein LOC113358754 isoform X1 [Papaver somniferum]
MKETEQAGDPQTFETPEKQKLRRGSRKRGSNSQVVSSRITRSRLAADWTTEELITLVTEAVAIDAAFSRALPSIQKWKMISDKCTALGVGRSSDQCHRKWESLLVDYKKIKDWESKRGLASYWSLEKERKMEHELPISFDAELFKCLDESLKLQGYQSESDHGGSESEAEVEKLNDITISDLKKQSGSTQGRQKSKRGPPKSKITETAKEQGKITVSVEQEGNVVETAENESIVAEAAVKKGRVGRPKVKITETTEHNGDVTEATEQIGGITQPAEEEGKAIEETVRKHRFGRPKTKVTETAEEEGKAIDETVQKRRFGRPKTKVTEMAEEEVNEEEGKAIDETVQKRRFGRPKTKVTETAEEEGKVTEAAVQKQRFGRPKTKVTEPAEQKGDRTVRAEQESKAIETAVQKGRVSGTKRKSTDTMSEQKGKETETAEENGKSTKVDVQKRVGRPKSKVIEMTQKTRADVELIHAILRGDLNPKDIDLNEPRNPGMLQTETGDEVLVQVGTLQRKLLHPGVHVHSQKYCPCTFRWPTHLQKQKSKSKIYCVMVIIDIYVLSRYQDKILHYLFAL